MANFSYVNKVRLIWQKISAERTYVNSLKPRQNGRHFADAIFKRIFLNENIRISIKISLKFVLKGPINNILALADHSFPFWMVHLTNKPDNHSIPCTRSSNILLFLTVTAGSQSGGKV